LLGTSNIASITEGVHWAAYIAADNGYGTVDCLEWTAKSGAKLSESDARHFFPEIDLPYRH